MAKRPPYVAVQTDIRKEERVAVLGDVGGYSEYEALGRIVTLWAWCADRKLENAPEDSDGYAVSEDVIRRFLGHNGVHAVLGGGCDDFALGVRRPDGLIYLRGTSETVKNLRAHAKGAVAGGESRHATGLRDNGRFVSHTTIAQPAHQPAASRTPAPLQLVGADAPAISSVDPTSLILDPTSQKNCSTASRAVPTADHGRVIAEFDSRFTERYQTKPTWGPKPGKLISSLLKQHTADEIIRRIGILFDTPPAFLALSPADVSTLAQHFDKLAAPAVRGYQSMPSQPPRKTTIL